MTEKLRFIVKEKFEEYTHLNLAYITGDGSLFEKANDALTHAGLIDLPEVYEVKRGAKGVIVALQIYPKTEKLNKMEELDRKSQELETLNKEVENIRHLRALLHEECEDLKKEIAELGDNNLEMVIDTMGGNALPIAEDTKIEGNADATVLKDKKAGAEKKTGKK